ncbi:MAG: TIGR03936 family radical SAM-associated protein [Spirochaetaceae bacterium]|jgi:radical SAM superfamily enzyme YgiQ (UPF0313 family)|nr:TIGR03936 family radical SAM-associated protein [Spirochaetaceae bacterium]
MTRFIDPLARLGKRLLEVEKPARYTGGEYGRLAKSGAALQTAVVFPDLYELGMSNQAFRILYNTLNRIDGISCDRAFAPAPDFEKLLKEEGVPLYGLDTGIPLGSTDLLLFSLGYELGINGILSVLDHSRIPLRGAGRGPGDPIVIIGGPCVSNPLPYSPFADAFWIGEAEAGFFDLCKTILGLKKAGAPRGDMLARITAHPHIWAPGKARTVRAIAADFGQRPQRAAVFPVSSIRTVQHHGSVEIMRGCPNGCRFCHAGMWYRPMRQKRADLVIREAEDFIRTGGYREISLSSLSSGDYLYITELVRALNTRYGGRHISFQLPSLKVSGFSLPLLSGISEVRKSGLTFAVETPGTLGQRSINKQVALEELISITAEAKKYGWRGVKFYFMIGLPVPYKAEEEEIADFVLEAGRASGFHFHINVGTFVPKPHTPYQRVRQLDEGQAWQKLRRIQERLKPRGHRVSLQNPFVSLLEGILARGNETVGGMVEEAYRRGCRLDAWSDHIRTDIWRDIIGKNSPLVQAILGGKADTEDLPWKCIHSGVGEGCLAGETAASQRGIVTSPCIENCTHPCGICTRECHVVKNSIHPDVNIHGRTDDETPVLPSLIPDAPVIPDTVPDITAMPEIVQNTAGSFLQDPVKHPDGETLRMLFSFVKTAGAVFISHLGVLEVFSMAVVRGGIPGLYTGGFNPLLKIDFAAPAATGLQCAGEIATLDLGEPLEAGNFIDRMNGALPEGFRIRNAQLFVIPGGAKKRSVAAILWGSIYGGRHIPAGEEKEYRSALGRGKNIFGLVRDGVLAADPDTGMPLDYFDVYRKYYAQT